MAPICHNPIYQNKDNKLIKLNEIVMVGSHDAAITSGGWNEKTQSLSILDQARVGVRLFDLRITGQIVGGSGEGWHGLNFLKKDNQPKNVELKSYHGKQPNKAVKSTMGDVKAVKKLSYGTWGMDLSEILEQASAFVEENPTQFLLLKFDKCDNWQQIAELCVKILGENLYKVSGNLNTTTLAELGGKVVVLFTPEGYRQVRNARETQEVQLGIHQIKNLYAGKDRYVDNFDGLQYWGKGGTKPVTPGSDRSIDENIEKQKKVFYERIKYVIHPDTMTMIYWTTTGLFGDIKGRTEVMWNDASLEKLADLWKSMRGIIIERLPENQSPDSLTTALSVRKIFPNFVMIDFVDSSKCSIIFSISKLTPTQIVELEKTTL